MAAEAPRPERAALLRTAAIVAIAVVAVAVVAFYVLIVSAGLSPPWPRWSAFYDAQAEGFRAGHLYALPPGPPGARIWDYTLYEGHHYLYWGLLPAAILAIVKAVLRLSVTVGDEVLVLVIFVMRGLAATLLLRSLARRMEPRPAPALVWLAILVVALANPTPYMLARAAVYEAAIAAGSVFLYLGLAAAVEGLFADDERRARRWLAAAGASFACAAASRVSLWPMAAALTVFLAFCEGRRRRLPPLQLVLLAARVGAPALAILLVCLALNRARFGAWLEFGTTYQVGFVFVMGWRFVPVNTFLNLFQPPHLSCRFPFVLAPWDASRAFTPQWVPWPDGFRATEPVTGILVGVPFVALALAAAVAWGRARRAPGGVAGSPWRVVGLCALGAVTSAIPIFAVYSVSMRYETDFLSFLLPLAAMAGWWLVSASPRPALRRVATVVFVGTAAASIFLGMALGFTGYFNHFQRHNPGLMQRLHKTIGVCRGP